jgi:hypothetical protein
MWGVGWMLKVSCGKEGEGITKERGMKNISPSQI